MILGVVRPSVIAVGDEEWQRSSWFVRMATGGAVAFSVLLPLIRVYNIAVQRAEDGGIGDRAIYAAFAFAGYLPMQVWLVLSATRGAAGPWRRLSLAGLLAVVLGMIPVFCVGWVEMLYLPAALVLVGVRPPWSLLLFAALVVTPAPVSFAFGQPEWLVYFMVGMLAFPVPLAVLILLIRATRQLQDARLALAEQAVVRERLRIDEEVRESVGDGLVAIADQGRLAQEMAARDPSAAIEELRALVNHARRTSAETRRIITRYREVSLLAELRTMAALLLAAGIDTRLELPPDLPHALDEPGRASLRRDVARLLEETAPSASVTIAVAHR
jgi:two-component system sensor histidine kinase DesK